MIAGLRAQAIKKIEQTQLVGVANRSLDSAQVFATVDGLPFATNDLTALLRRPGD